MLSKSKMLSGRQCRKRLYLEVHHPELREESKGLEARFRVGHEVGELARAMYPDGVLIQQDANLSAALRDTQTELKGSGKKVLFEATLAHGGVLVRTDVLIRNGKEIELKEVKSSTKVKDYYFEDVAVQAWVLNGAGFPPRKAVLTHVNNEFVYGGSGNYSGLLTDQDLSKEIEPLLDQVPKWVREFETLLKGKEPEIETGEHCFEPFECPFYGHCSKNDPEYPVEILPRGGATVLALRKAGYRDLKKVPKDALSSAKHLRVWQATRTGTADIVRGAGSELAKLAYPRYHMDFETAMMAIPIWVGTRPYEKLPFQWSRHIERADGSMDHAEFLDLSGNAPMRGFAESLIKTLGAKGPVFSFSHYEKTILRQEAKRYLDLAKPIENIIERIVDLKPLAERSYYHPAMMGSWSIKGIVPTIDRKLDYANLGEVQEGMGAQDAYLEAIHKETPGERRRSIERDLLKYCARDTEAMVALAAFLQKRC